MPGSENVWGTKGEASKRLREVLGRKDKGLSTPSPSRMPTFAAQAEVWKAGEVVMRDRTRRDYVELLDRYVIPKLGHVKLDAIHASMIKAEVTGPLVKRGKVRTAQRCKCSISVVYEDALGDTSLGLNGNPARGWKVGKAASIEIQPLTDDERAAFRTAIRGTTHECLWVTLLLTGMSPHEALGLGWEHVDLEAGELRVRRTLDCKARALVAGVKSEKRKREVTLVTELRAMLRERWMAAGQPETGLVFASERGEPLDLQNLRNRHFKPALKAAEITRRVRVYDLRHGFATMARKLGYDANAVSELLGNSVETVQRVYFHVEKEETREATFRIGDALAS